MTGILGAVVNAAAVILGGLIGAAFGKALSDRISDSVMKGLGLAVILIGVSGALDGQNTLVTILSLAIGALIGELIDIDRHLDRLTKAAESRFGGASSKGGRFAEGMFSGLLLFCVGAMTVVGSLDAGLTGDCTTIYTKSLIDLIAATLLASTLGIGVAFAAIPLLLYQGLLTLGAHFLAPLLSEAIVAEMTCTGSLLILALGLRMIGVAKLKVANFLPAIFLPIAFCPLFDLISDLLSRISL